MFTPDDARALGWKLVTAADDGAAIKGEGADAITIYVTSATPLCSLLLNVAELEGKGFAQGYGGAEPITAALVLACSGETYIEPPPPSPLPPSMEKKIATALAVVEGDPVLAQATKDALGSVITALAAAFSPRA